jgi:hypothetical protein
MKFNLVCVSSMFELGVPIRFRIALVKGFGQKPTVTGERAKGMSVTAVAGEEVDLSR